MKRIYKYGTGSKIPDGAIYLCTIKNGLIESRDPTLAEKYYYVWHYFLVEVKK